MQSGVPFKVNPGGAKTHRFELDAVRPCPWQLHRRTEEEPEPAHAAGCLQMQQEAMLQVARLLTAGMIEGETVKACLTRPLSVADFRMYLPALGPRCWLRRGRWEKGGGGGGGGGMRSFLFTWYKWQSTLQGIRESKHKHSGRGCTNPGEEARL